MEYSLIMLDVKKKPRQKIENVRPRNSKRRSEEDKWSCPERTSAVCPV